MRKLYWYLTAYVKKHGLTVVISVIGAILVFSLLMPFFIQKINIKKRVYIGIVGEYNLQNLPKEIKNNLSMGLTKVDIEDQSIKPLLAERWVTENEGHTYRFPLKKDLFWQDGLELTPETINYNLRDVEVITTPNDIIFKLPDTFAPFPAIVSEPIFRQVLERHFLFFKRPNIVGVGPYRISSYKQKGNRLQEIILDGPEDRLVYRFYLTENDALTGFKKGEVDVLREIRQPEQLTHWDDRNITLERVVNYDQYLAIFFNHNDPIITRNLKQALYYSLEKPKGDERAVSPISPRSWAYLAGGKDYAKDWDRAVERILSGLPNQKLDLSLTTTSIYLEKANQIKQQWEKFGEYAYEKCQAEASSDEKKLCENVKISVNLKISNFPDTNDYQLLLLGQEIPIDPDQYFLWHSDQPTNFTNYKNTRVDSLLEKGRQTLDQRERQTVYQEFQQFLLEDPPAIFLEYLPSYTVRRK
ncbi:MAG: Peptide/nickel ABC transporter, substrate-binding protein [Microgenomates bacterium 39_7]|nr:MAG: Peptide/nickel ABC transporter, substrate-binding protein [Microgenomates bacterium 39_7]